MKYTLYIIAFTFLSSCYGKKPPKVTTGHEGKPMPVIDLMLIDSTQHFSTNSVPTGKPSLLFAFEPWCPYCKAQAKSIIAHIETLKDINIYMLTNSTYPEFKKFYDRFHLEKYPTIIAGIDYKYIFARFFQTNSVPYIAIYDKDRRLKQVLMGKNYISMIKEIALK